MGLDFVELVLECEEQFAVELENDRLEHVRTAGELFELMCEKLNLPSGPEEPHPVAREFIPLASPPEQGWSRDSVWFRVVRICVEQLQVSEEEVKYHASFLEDLRAD